MMNNTEPIHWDDMIVLYIGIMDYNEKYELNNFDQTVDVKWLQENDKQQTFEYQYLCENGLESDINIDE